MAKYKGKVLIGEASDSESDEEIETAELSIPSKWSPAFPSSSNINVKVPRRTADREAIVVLGEASESSEEEIVTDNRSYRSVVKQQTLRVDNYSCATSNSEKRTGLQHHSLLHKKLRERNAILGKRVTIAARQPYDYIAKEINSMSSQLVKCQSEIQEIGPILRQINNNLDLIDEKMDSALDVAKLIPPIKIKIPTASNVL